jgi:predicted phosphodiesterase
MTGRETYNPEIAERWIGEIPRKILEVCPGDSYSYSGVDIILAGDLVDGEEIYPTHARHLQLSVIDQTKGLVKALWRLTKELQRLFGDARIVSVRGNHGRMSQSADERSNWDNMVYQQLALLAEIEGDATLRMECSHGEFCNFEVNGWKGHVRHVAVPHDGTAAVRNKIGSWKQMHNFDFLVCGHYHNCGILNYNDTMIIRNGAMMPQNDYAERLALGGSPRQIIFGVSTDHLPTFISYLTWKQH